MAKQSKKPSKQSEYIDIEKQYGIPQFTEDYIKKAMELNKKYPGSKFVCTANGCADIASQAASAMGHEFGKANAWEYGNRSDVLFTNPAYSAELQNVTGPLHNPTSYGVPKEFLGMENVLVGLNRKNNLIDAKGNKVGESAKQAAAAKTRSEANDSIDYANQELYPGSRGYEHIGYMMGNNTLLHGTAASKDHPAFFVLDDIKNGIDLAGYGQYEPVEAIAEPTTMQSAVNKVKSLGSRASDLLFGEPTSGKSAAQASFISTKKKNGGWLEKYNDGGETEKYISKEIPKTFGKNVAASDKPSEIHKPLVIGDPYAAEMARRQTSIGEYDRSKKASPKLEKLLQEQEESKKRRKEMVESLEGIQNKAGALEMLSVIPTPLTEALGLGAGIVNAGTSALLSANALSNEDYLGALSNAAIGATSAYPLGAAVSNFRGLKALPGNLMKSRSLNDVIGASMSGITPSAALSRMSTPELKIANQVQDIKRLGATNAPKVKQYQTALEMNLPEDRLVGLFGKGKDELEREITARSAYSDVFGGLPPAPGSTPMSEGDSLQRLLQRARTRRDEIDAARVTDDVPSTYISPEQQMEINAEREAYREGGGGDLDIDNMSNAEYSRIMGELDNRINEMERRGGSLTPLNDLGRPVSNAEPVAMTAEEIRRSNASARYNDLIDEDYADAVNREIEQGVIDLRRGSRSIDYNDLYSRTEKPSLAQDLNQLADDIGGWRSGLKKSIQNKVTNYIHPYESYSGPVRDELSLLVMGSSGKQGVASEIHNALQRAERLPQGSVITGSTNTSHSSYLPQLKTIFGQAGKLGEPVFLGYKPMNSMGFLSSAGYGTDDIAKYMNAEIDQMIKKGRVPSNVFRPYKEGEHILLPHYGIKKTTGEVAPNLQEYNFEDGGIIGEGFTNRGRHYSPAWGGQFAMGGSIPGAVGFTYARTNDPAPSNGPYAKKTKASAENGTEMKFYQEGLDWKPKTISKDGSQLVKLDQLTNFTNYNTKQPGGWLDKYEG